MAFEIFTEDVDLDPNVPDFILDHVTSNLLTSLEQHEGFPGLTGHTFAILSLGGGKSRFVLENDITPDSVIEAIMHSSLKEQVEQTKRDLEHNWFRLVAVVWNDLKITRFMVHANPKQ